MIMSWEMDFLRFLEGLRGDVVNKVFEFITMLGEGPFAFGVIAIFYFIFNKKFGKQMLYVYGTGANINNTLKILVNRTRPFNEINGVEPVRRSTATGYSFPSGHSESIASIQTLIATKYKKVWGYILGALLTLIVGFSRLILGCHYPSDVIVGISVGIIATILLSIAYSKVKEEKLYLITILCFIPFMVFTLIRQDLDHADFFKTTGLVIGCGLGVFIENKYVKFELEEKLLPRLLRLVVSLIPALLFYLGPKVLISKEVLASLPIIVQFLIAGFRYFAMGLILVGVGPLLYKKLFEK